MGRILALAFVVAAATLATGCATVTGSTTQTVALLAKNQNGEDVTEAKCELNNDKGRWYLTTPGSVMVQRSNEDMKIVCDKTGHETARKNVVSEVKGSMYGNIILGGGVGAIIDHANGSAYEYPAVIQLDMRALSKEEIAALAEKAAQKPAPVVPVQAVATGSAAPNMVPLAIATGRKPRKGDEWEYVARETMWGKEKNLLWRVNAVLPDAAGVREDLLVDGIPVQQSTFNGKANLVGTPTDSGIFFGSHWDGQQFPTLSVIGTGECATRLRCEVTGKVTGLERISVPAGTFDALRIDGTIAISYSGPRFSNAGQISVWYSEKDRRLLKQTVSIHLASAGVQLDEIMELQVARTYQ